MSAKKLVLVGSGRHFKFMADALSLLSGFEVVGVLDAGLSRGSRVLGIEVIGDDKLLPELREQGVSHAFISLGSIGDCARRSELREELDSLGFELPVIAHPCAVIAPSAVVEAGVFVGATAIVSPDASVGECAIINMGAIVGGDCRVGRFCHIAPGAVLGGGVSVGDFSHVGSGSAIRQELTIGQRCMIGVGSTVVKDVPDGATVYSPAALTRES